MGEGLGVRGLLSSFRILARGEGFGRGVEIIPMRDEFGPFSVPVLWQRVSHQGWTDGHHENNQSNEAM